MAKKGADYTPGLGGDEAVLARAAEPATEKRLRVLMLTDIITDMGPMDHEVESVNSAAQAAGFDAPVLLDVDRVGVSGALETLRTAREAGKPFDVLVQDIWSRAGLLDGAKAQQPGLYIVEMVFMEGGRATSDSVVNKVVIKRTGNLGSQMGAAFRLAKEAISHPQLAA